MSGQALLEEGKKQFISRQSDLGEAAFRQLCSTPNLAAEGFYGLGRVCLHRGNLDDAKTFFQNSLKIQPRHANAMYHLGVIAESRGAETEALDHFRRALEVNPNHASALQKLRSHRTEDHRSLPAVALGTETQERFGVYEHVLKDSSACSEPTFDLMDDVQIHTRPTLTSHLSGFVALVLLLPVGGILMAKFSGARGSQMDDAMLVGAVLGVLPLLYYLLRLLTTRITIDKGRLQIRRGILIRTLKNIELWRVRDVELHRIFLDLLTRDGSLIFRIHNDRPLVVRGLARGRRLDGIYQKLLSLVFFLRSNSVVKGIIS